MLDFTPHPSDTGCNKQRKKQHNKEPQMSNANITAGQIIKTAYGHIGQVFSTNGTTAVVIEIRSDNVYAEIGVFHNSKVYPIQ